MSGNFVFAFVAAFIQTDKHLTYIDGDLSGVPLEVSVTEFLVEFNSSPSLPQQPASPTWAPINNFLQGKKQQPPPQEA